MVPRGEFKTYHPDIKRFYYFQLLHDIYLSEEYYGENVLHMGCVAEDASLVKWLLDIGSDFHRRCYGNFFCCDDQKIHR